MTRDVITFSGDMLHNEVTELIEKVSSSEKESVEIYFSSGGGELDQMERLLDFFKRTEGHGDVHFIFCGVISSCAFEFAVRVKAKTKTVLRATMSKLHAYSYSLQYREDVLRMGTDCPHTKYIKQLNAELGDFLYYCGMEEDNIATVQGGHEVIIYEERIRKCIEEYARKEEEIQS